MAEFQSSHFRIGNIVLINRNGINVVSVVYLLNNTGDVGVFYDRSIDNADGRITSPKRVQGVIITPDILKACGFEPKVYNRSDLSTDVHGKDLVRMKKCGIYCFFRDGKLEYVEVGGTQRRHIKYLHQIQNLHFALTGKEMLVAIKEVVCILQGDKKLI